MKSFNNAEDQLEEEFCVRLEAKQRLRYSDGLKDGLI